MTAVPEQWAEKARYDLDTAKAMLESGRYLYVLFCCQQAVEKALKGVIARRTGEMPLRLHNLIRLAEEAGFDTDAVGKELVRLLTNWPCSVTLSRGAGGRRGGCYTRCSGGDAEAHRGDSRMGTSLDRVMARAAGAVAALSRSAQVAAAFVFGSQVTGGATAESDIDLAVFVRGCEKWDLMERARAASRIQAEVGDDIEIHFFPAEALEHREPASFAAYVKQHGVRVDEAVVQRAAEQGPPYRTRRTER